MVISGKDGDLRKTADSMQRADLLTPDTRVKNMRARPLRKHPIGVLEPLHLGPVNPKHEILKSLMWDMRFGQVLG
jgi:hypothetical protein